VRRIKRGGAVLLAVSALIGLGFTLWLTWSLTRLRNYAHGLANGEKLPAPTSGGRQLSELASALQTMRERLDGKQYVEQYAQTLTHEMKSPLAAIRGAAELLQDNPPEADRARFIANIRQQSERLQTVIDRLLELVRLEHLQRPEKQQRVRLRELAEEVEDNGTCQSAITAPAFRTMPCPGCSSAFSPCRVRTGDNAAPGWGWYWWPKSPSCTAVPRFSPIMVKAVPWPASACRRPDFSCASRPLHAAFTLPP